MSKKFFIEVSKLDPDGVPTLEQWDKRTLVGTCMAPIVINRLSYDGFDMASLNTDDEVAELATEIDHDWRNGIEATLGEELVIRGFEAGRTGVIVFELVPCRRNATMDSTGPRRFYIFRIGSDRALYVTDSIADAFSEARKLAKGIAVDGNKVRNLAVPPQNNLSSRYEV